ncbi:MAG: type I methionyl aminopeptidase [Caldiserica bacterium]|nr:MAG: type I methionyl aminopeptidase [Caldisericota bacterium]
MVVLKKDEEIKIMREAGRKLSEVMEVLINSAKEGVKTKELEEIAYDEIRKRDCMEAFQTQGFPSCICTSVNEEIVHGIPGEYVLKEGDILSIDAGLIYKGFFSDMAVTIGIGNISKVKRRLIEITEKALYDGIKSFKDGNTIGDIGFSIENTVRKNNFKVIKLFVGHGIGRRLQEPPEVPNYGTPKKGVKIRKGMVLAIEPMVSSGTDKIRIKKDGWTAVTADGSPSAHFEHTVALTDNGTEILTRRN